jgi:hypothetical protein
MTRRHEDTKLLGTSSVIATRPARTPAFAQHPAFSRAGLRHRCKGMIARSPAALYVWQGCCILQPRSIMLSGNCCLRLPSMPPVHASRSRLWRKDQRWRRDQRWCSDQRHCRGSSRCYNAAANGCQTTPQTANRGAPNRQKPSLVC